MTRHAMYRAYPHTPGQAGPLAYRHQSPATAAAGLDESVRVKTSKGGERTTSCYMGVPLIHRPSQAASQSHTRISPYEARETTTRRGRSPSTAIVVSRENYRETRRLYYRVERCCPRHDQCAHRGTCSVFRSYSRGDVFVVRCAVQLSA